MGLSDRSGVGRACHCGFQADGSPVDTGPSMLIRPDACVAWAGEENSTGELVEALRRWFKPIPRGGPWCDPSDHPCRNPSQTFRSTGIGP